MMRYYETPRISIDRFVEEYEFLNNFYPCRMELDNIVYPNAEVAYQAQKCTDTEEKRVFSQLDPMAAKRRGRALSPPPDWDRVRRRAMERVLRAKFLQNPELAAALLDTGDRMLQEGNGWHDLYWGVDLKTGAGENHLGLLLMALRADLRAGRLVPAAANLYHRAAFPGLRICLEDRDITCSDCACIVNAANETLLGGSGVDGAIHRAAGPELRAECRLLGGCRTGEAKLTKGYRLKAAHVIHTVGPVYGGPDGDEALSACYQNALELAAAHHIPTIAFPILSAGKFGYPPQKAAEIAVAAVRRWLEAHPESPMTVTFSCVQPALYAAMEKTLSRLARRGSSALTSDPVP